MELEDELIVQGIRKGDMETFRKIFENYYKRMFFYAKSYVGNHSESEDIVQDLFFHLWDNRKEFVINTSLSSYLFRAIHNRSIQYLRHKKVIEGYESLHVLKIKEAEVLLNCAGDFTFSEHQLEEIQSIFNKTNKTLPVKTREIFRLSRENLMSNKEIANLLNLQVKTIEYHITKALKIFHIAMRDYFA